MGKLRSLKEALERLEQKAFRDIWIKKQELLERNKGGFLD